MSNIGNYNGSSSQGDSAMVINEKLRPILAEVVGDYLHVASAEASGSETNYGYTYTAKHRLFDANGSAIEGFGSFVSSGVYLPNEKTILGSKVQQLYGNKFLIQGLAYQDGQTYYGVFGKQAYGISSHNLDGTIDTNFVPLKPVNNIMPYHSCGLSTGKILVGGNSVFAHDRYHTGIYRLNADGSVDNTFNPGGSGFISQGVSIFRSDGQAIVRFVLELSDGRIAVAHSCPSYNGVQVSKCVLLSADGDFITDLDTSVLSTDDPTRLFEFKGKLFLFYGYSGNNIVFDLTTYAIDATYTIPRVDFIGGYGAGIDKSGDDLFFKSNVDWKLHKYIDGLTVDANFIRPTTGTFRGILSDGNLLYDSATVKTLIYTIYSKVDGSLITTRTINFETSNYGYNHGFIKTATGFYTIMEREPYDVQIVGFNNDLSDITNFTPIQLRFGLTATNEVPYLTLAGDKIIYTRETNQCIDAKGGYKKPYVIVSEGSVVKESTPFLETGVIEDTCITDDGTLIAGDFRVNDNVGIAKLDTNMIIDPQFTAWAIGGKVNSVNTLTDGNYLISGGFNYFNASPARGNSVINTAGEQVNKTALGNYDAIQTTMCSDGTWYSLLRVTYGLAMLVKLNSDLTIDHTFNPIAIRNTVSEFKCVRFALDATGVYIFGDISNIEIQGIVTPTTFVKLTHSGSIDTTFTYVPTTPVLACISASSTVYVIETAGVFNRLDLDGTVHSQLDTIIGQFSDSIADLYRSPVNIAEIDGQLYIFGSFTGFKYGDVLVSDIFRIDYDGTIDTTFSSGSGVFGDIRNVKPVSGSFLALTGKFINYSVPTGQYSSIIDTDGKIEAAPFQLGLELQSTDARYQSIAKQSTGKTIISGYFTQVWDGKKLVTRPGIARLNADGTLDDSFNTGVTTAFNNLTNLHMHVDEQDRIYVVGDFTSYRGVSSGNVRIIRLLPDGAKDATFVTGTGFNAVVTDLVVDGTGLYCVGNFTTYKGVAAKRICKIDFAGNRIAAFNVGTGFTAPNNIHWYPSITLDDNSVYVCGLTNTTYKGIASTSMVAKLDSTTATRDDAFVVNTGIDSQTYGDGIVHKVACTVDAVYCVGTINSIIDADNLYYPTPGLIKLSKSGVVDKTLANYVNTGFNTAADVVTYNASNGVASNIYDVAVIGTSILVSGDFDKFGNTVTKNFLMLSSTGVIIEAYANQYDCVGASDSISVLDGKFYIANLNKVLVDDIVNQNIVLVNKSNGELVNAIDYTQFPVASYGIDDCIYDSNTNGIYFPVVGSIYVLSSFGMTNTINKLQDYLVDSVTNTRIVGMSLYGNNIMVTGNIRYLQDTSIKQLVVIDSNGLVVPDTLNGNDFNGAVLCVKEVLAGKIVCVGEFTAYGSTEANGIIMLNIDGTIDNTFIYGTGFNNKVNCVTVLDTHKIVCEGNFTEYNGVLTDGMIALNPDGSIYYNYSISSAEGLAYDSILYRNKQVLYGRKMLTANKTINDVAIGFMESTGKIELTRSSTDLDQTTYGYIKDIVQLATDQYLAITSNRYIIRLKGDLTLDLSVTPIQVGGGGGGLSQLALTDTGDIAIVGSFSYTNSYRGYDVLGNLVDVDDYATTLVSAFASFIVVDADLNLIKTDTVFTKPIHKITRSLTGKLILSGGEVDWMTNTLVGPVLNGVQLGTVFMLESDYTLSSGFDNSTINLNTGGYSMSKIITHNGSIFVPNGNKLTVMDLSGTILKTITSASKSQTKNVLVNDVAFNSVGDLICAGQFSGPEGTTNPVCKINGLTFIINTDLMTPTNDQPWTMERIIGLSDNLFIAGSGSGVRFLNANLETMQDCIRNYAYLLPMLVNDAGQILFVKGMGANDQTVIEIEPKHSYIRQCDMNGNILSTYRGR